MANLIPSGAGASPVSQTFGAGLYYPIPNAIGFSTAAMTASRLRVHPFFVPSPCRVQRIGGEVTAAGSSGGKIRVVVYGMRTGLNASKPGALVWDSGVDGDTSTYTNDGFLNGASVGPQSIGADLVLFPGWYYRGFVLQGVTTSAPTIRVIAGSSSFSQPFMVDLGASLPAAATAGNGWYVDSITGAPPDPFGTPGGLSATSPYAFIKV